MCNTKCSFYRSTHSNVNKIEELANTVIISAWYSHNKRSNQMHMQLRLLPIIIISRRTISVLFP
jgi:hypothetical protein